MRFISASALGLIATLSTLLLLDLECDLDTDGVDDNMQNTPRHLKLGRVMDFPIQYSARGGGASELVLAEGRTPYVSTRFSFCQGQVKRN